MGSNLVIVAIPDENDHVWKVSSEKVPHLTLLFLGEIDAVQNLEDIILFVEHASDTMLHPFYLTVDHRGELGADQADVLFFKTNQYDCQSIRRFRTTLLQDNNIRTAYDSATQFDNEWQPHLTLGYPATPAKPDDRDYGIYDVGFDRIAVWTEDFDGPEFRLKEHEFPGDTMPMSVVHAAKVSDTPWSQFKDSDYTDEQYARACLLDRGENAGTAKQRYGIPVREPSGTLNRNACHAAAAVLSSKGGTGSARGSKVKGTPEQIAAAKKKLVALYNGPLNEDLPAGLGGEMKQAVDLGVEFLDHHGVKGQKWGVRRDTGHEGEQVKTKKLAKLDKKFEKKTLSPDTFIALHNGAADGVNKEMGAFNKRFEDKYGKEKMDSGVLWNDHDPITKEYHQAYNEMFVKHLNATAEKMGTNPSGTRKVKIYTKNMDSFEEFNWSWGTEKVKHAAEDTGPDTLTFVVDLDDQGRILSVKPGDAQMKQTVDLGSEFLDHHGVKGQKWGVRKEQVSGAAKSAGKTVARGAKATGRGVSTFAKDVFFESTTRKQQVTNEVHETANANFVKHDIPRIDAKYKGTKGGTLGSRLKNPLDKDTRAYRAESRIAYRDRVNEAVKALPGNASGTRRYEIEDHGKTNARYAWTLKAVDVKKTVTHANDTPDPELPLEQFNVRPVFDDDGFITDVKLVEGGENNMAQSVELGEAFILEHYGIKGMRWGVRRERDVSATPLTDTGILRRRTKVQTKGGESHPPHPDAVVAAVQKQKLKKSGTDALSTNELQSLQRRLQLEAQVESLSTKKGKKFVSRQIEETGKQELQRGLGKGIRTHGPSVARRVKRGAATAATIGALAV